MQNCESFVLIKPDGQKKLEALKKLNELLDHNALTITEKSFVELSKRDVIRLWPAYSKCVISKKLLIEYLAEKKLELWKVEGENAVGKLNLIKKEVRNAYGKGCIANCIHTPLDSYEAEWQYEILKKTANKEIYFDANNIHEGPFGKILDYSNDEIERAVNEALTSHWTTNNPEKLIWNNNIKNKQQVILKLVDQINISMDYVASALLELFGENYSLDEIIKIILDVDEYGERGIIVTDLGNATKLKKILIDEYKLDVSIEKIIPFAKDNYTN